MHKKFKTAGLLAILLSAWMEADAAGLGRLTVQSALGQPLKAEIELYSVTRDELPSVNARLANVDAFRQARIDRQDALNNLRFSVEQRANGQPIVRITSSTPISDPFLDLLIELNWASGRLLREYTLLLDPPAEAKPAPATPPAPPVTAAPPVSKPQAEDKPAAAPKAAEAAKPPAVKEEAKPEKAIAKEYGPVEKGETLRAIAIKLRGQDTTTEQMMVGLFQANQDAFFDGDMNRLKKGRVLKVPDFESLMLTASPSQAREMVRQQAAAWRAGQGMAGDEGAAAAKDKAAAAGKIEPSKPEAKPAPAAPGKDVLKLSKGEPVAAGKADAKTADRLHAMEEDLAAKSRALKEAQDKVAQLEKTVKDLQRLIELKGQQAATVPVPEAKPAAPAVPVEAAKPLPPVEPKPAPKPVIVPAPAPESSLVDEIMGNPLYLAGGGAGALLLTLVGISIARRRKQKAAPAEVPSVEGGDLFGEAAVPAAAAGVAAAAAAQQDSGVLTDFSRLGLGAIDTQEIDPIAEAEVYLAYGKEAQAEEILRDALAKHPDREDVLLKLLEIYHARKDIATFEATARNLQTAVGGDADNASWIKAAEMGREIDPGNPLYALAAAAEAPVEVAAEAEPVSMLDMEIPAMESLEMPAEPAAEAQAAPEAPASVLPVGLDFEFSMALPDEGKVPSEPQAQAEAEEIPGLDFQVEPAEEGAAGVEAIDTLPPLEEEAMAEPVPTGLAEQLEQVEPAMREEEVEGLEAMPSLEGLESELAPDQPAVEAATEAPVSQLPDLDFGDLDLELSTSAPEAEAAASVPAEKEPGAEMELPDLDIGSLDFAGELTEVPAVPTEAPLPDLELGDLELDMAEAEASVAAEPEISIEAPVSESEEALAEVNTKLDLARAYIEMGDKEGAREILEEVLTEGNNQQVEEANKLLAEAS